MSELLDHFKLKDEKEAEELVVENIDNAVVFRGTNLWILIFAIFIASLGLNVNSTAVIIGAMLVSPLMGPIIGMGFGMAVNDLALLRKALTNYGLAVGVSLATSTIYFLLSPINDAHSEILARTAPNIYDVLIAFFGGLAGILALASKNKGNVIPGVAIATALMPPLCTAGYGLATWQLYYFFGAFYLFIINSVFIALATLITVRFLRFPYKRLPTEKDETRAKRIVWGLVLVTLVPSIYLGYDIVQQNRFQKKAESFVQNEAAFPNDYLLKQNIDAKRKTITLTYGGEKITDEQIKALKERLKKYDLISATLTVQQGFAYLKETKDNKSDEQLNKLSVVLSEKQAQIQSLQSVLDSINRNKDLSAQVLKEINAQYPYIKAGIVQPATEIHTDTIQDSASYVVVLKGPHKMPVAEERRISDWLKVRLNTKNVKLFFE